ncbi:MAG: hypothetical protein MJE66_09420 [Proteobacteria bacterium]|nr:hypothetical protein [Pseudomonadota bacterium]
MGTTRHRTLSLSGGLSLWTQTSVLALALLAAGSPARAEGEIFDPPAAQLPLTCIGPWAPFLCQSDPVFEFALEQEYWGHLGNGQFDGLGGWIWKTKSYLVVVNGMSDRVRARFESFIAFGYVGQYVQGAIFDPFNLVNMLDAIFMSNASQLHDPNSPNALSLHNYLEAYLAFAVSDTATGHANIDDLYEITEVYGPIAGSEGEVVGAMAQMLLVDDSQVAIGLATLDDCQTVACQRNSSVAPYKEVGMQIAIAEGYARLGDYASMEAAFDKARAYAVAHNHPYPELIDLQEAQLTGPGGVIEQWQTTTETLGDIKLPLPPSAGANACQPCHAAGFQTINHYD